MAPASCQHLVAIESKIQPRVLNNQWKIGCTSALDGGSLHMFSLIYVVAHNYSLIEAIHEIWQREM
jgi:hypothetical protein